MTDKHIPADTQAKMKEAQADYLSAFPWHRLDPETLNELAQFMYEHGFDMMPLAQPKKEETQSC